MRILLLTAGSRGDVEPFLALGRRAVRDGHTVRIGVTREFVATAEKADLDAAALDANYAELVAEQGVSPLAAMRSFRSTIMPMMTALLRSTTAVATAFRPDVLVYHPKLLAAPLAAAALDVPAVLAEIVPVVTPTREFPAAGVTTANLGPFNRITFRATEAANRMFAKPLRELRSELALPARGPIPGPARALVPVSPALLRRPADWPETTVITGQWHEPDTTEPDAETAEFLAGGNVIYAGFGSMAVGDARERANAVVAAARAVGHRVLLVTGWGGLASPDDPTDVLVRKSVPHHGVLPRCVAAVHHGGAGTVHAVVRAGLPSVVVPFLADQPFWAGLLHRQGLAAEPLPVRRLTADRLARRLATLPTPAAAAIAAERLATEDGCDLALTTIAG
ncbi:glycosyltransferase [Kutzneria sp. NPDC052558]|uniref:glycosyltransferase n=1 Tax=Kutzneria sp. NPDC052558 TaxID=3364121 RepID=UPI0037C7F1AB